MKRLLLILTTLGALIAPTVAPAQRQAGIKVQVPFEFVVADRSFPQGEYVISALGDQVFVRNSEGKTVAMVLSNAISGHSTSETGQAVFQCYGRHCFLSEVWNPTQVAGRRLMKSNWEREIAKKETAKYFALVASGNN